MASLRIKIKNGGRPIPDGTVLFEDAAQLTGGLSDSLARIVQFRLGDRGRGRISKDARDLSALLLVGVSSGSGILECDPLALAEQVGRPPSIVAAIDMIEGINSFAATGRWPASFPAVARNRLGAALAPVISDGTLVELEVDEGSGTRASHCYLDSRVRDGLQQREVFEIQPVRLTGKIFDINVSSGTFKVDGITKKVSVPYGADRWSDVDRLRWKTVVVEGLPTDHSMKKLSEISVLREALPDEEAGVVLPLEAENAEGSSVFRHVAQQLEGLTELGPNWDSYSARPPIKGIAQYGRSFIRDMVCTFGDRELTLPTPFVAPTAQGTIQFEWSVSGRELELEIERPDKFCYLRVFENHRTEEGSAGKWAAMRLLNWVATGEPL